ncbi:MarR family transcriptional regulator [Poseidonibacter lekithochrous]|uniref:MarR family winged helix-turn-helix transcriptional regulator n=1 Tax=Poseidonibacter TaxID=2321187 RepID=UPI001C0808B4|nr:MULTISPECIES: MarR family transcriptional regulator [Poseidonibacter]MBU3015845.1 MarR family transcriptional regulator [Poseidonibacter lekithochrous]MDO6829144.1 MarR family transcriptional regulator [Poseidonibacter sp. 1_MG-2023]
MNIKQFESNLENVKKLTPQIFKDTMQLSVPFFMLHKKIYDDGEDLILKEFNINQSELDVLFSLYYEGGDDFTMSPTQLYDLMVFSSGGMTKLLKKLENKKFIIRIENKLDKRSNLVQITQLGIEITLKALKDILSFEDEYFSKLNKNEQTIFKKLIYKMLD